MILTCPACGKRYRVSADAIPAEGKLVRCAACRHGWVAVPDDDALLLDDVVEAVAPSAVPPATPVVSPAHAPALPDRDGDQPSPVEDPPAAPTLEAPPSDTWSAYDDDPPRRRVWPWVILTVVVFAAAAIAAWALVPRRTLDRFGIPALAIPAFTAPHIDIPRVTISLPPLNLGLIPLVGPTLDRWFDPPPAPVSPLRIEVSGERRRLANGTRLLVLNGRVINPTATAQTVPPIAAALVAADGRAYRWRIDAPVATLPAGQTAAFESVTANWPEAAQRLDLGFATQR